MARRPRSIALTWAAPALDDLDDIAAFIALDGPAAAADLVARVLAALERLRRFPSSGRRVPELQGKSYREVIVPPLRILCRRERGGVLIVHVTRGERPLGASDLRRR